MSDLLLAIWESAPVVDTEFLVIPDGCRDLIMQVSPEAKPRWFISPLQDGVKVAPVGAGVFLRGFRLKPGTGINETELLKSVNRLLDHEEAHSRINDACRLPQSVAEALACLASDVNSVEDSAKLLGVNKRTLQRLLLRETGKPPLYWRMLARVRQAAFAVSESAPLSEVAYAFQFADQAHMTREFKRWLDITPSKIKNESTYFKQLKSAGYG